MYIYTLINLNNKYSSIMLLTPSVATPYIANKYLIFFIKDILIN